MQPQGVQAVVRAILEGTGGKGEFSKVLSTDDWFRETLEFEKGFSWNRIKFQDHLSSVSSKMY